MKYIVTMHGRNGYASQYEMLSAGEIMIMQDDRFGVVKLTTIRRDFDRLREAVRVCDDPETEVAWVEAENVREKG